MITRKSWTEFRKSGLLWFINTILHAFGWAICVEVDEKTGYIKEAFPARVKFRGFSEQRNTEGYIQLSEYLKRNIDDIAKEAKE